MTIEKLQGLVRVISNSLYVRWWAHWNHPQEKPWEMAISAIDASGKQVELPDLLKDGFHEKTMGLRRRHIYYIIERTNENGTPFELKRSELSPEDILKNIFSAFDEALCYDDNEAKTILRKAGLNPDEEIKKGMEYIKALQEKVRLILENDHDRKMQE